MTLFSDLVDSLQGCDQCDWDEASGRLIDHCDECCRKVTGAAWGYTTAITANEHVSERHHLNISGIPHGPSEIIYKRPKHD